MKIFIKYMVSLRCKLIVTSELNKMGIQHITVDQGQVEIPGELSETQRLELTKMLRRKGLEVLDESLSSLIERTTDMVIDMVRLSDGLPQVEAANYIGNKINYDPVELSTIFAEVKGISLDAFVIYHKMEFIKELLLYDQLTIGEISKKLRYENVEKLTYQFQKFTGLTPRHFKTMRKIRIMASNGMLAKIAPPQPRNR